MNEDNVDDNFLTLEVPDGLADLAGAIAYGAPANEVRTILARKPGDKPHCQAIFDIVRQLALRKVALKGSILRLLIAHDPFISSIRHENDGFLLHTVCWAWPYADTLRLLLRLNPDAACQVDNDESGRFPLHCACESQFDVPLAAMELLVRSNPQAVRERNGNGDLPVVLAYKKGMVSNYPPGDRELIGNGGAYKRGFQRSFLGIKFLIEQYPEALNEVGSHGNLLLHGAEGSYASLFLGHDGYNAAAQNDYGELPLHLAMDTDTARLLIESYPEGLRTPSRNGKLPIHHACLRRNTPVSHLELLIACCPESVRVPDSLGNLPLHDAARLEALPLIEVLLQHHPDAIHVANDNGHLPLHLACRWSTRRDIARLLIEMDPFTLLHKDKHSCSALQWAFQTKYPNMETLIFIFTQQEKALKSLWDAVDFTTGEKLRFPDLVVDKIFEFVDPGLWTPSEEDWARASSIRTCNPTCFQPTSLEMHSRHSSLSSSTLR